MSIDLNSDRWDLSDTEAHLLLLHLQENEDENVNKEVPVLSFIRHHFIFIIDLSPSVFSAADGDYVLYDAVIASLFSVLRQLLTVSTGWKTAKAEQEYSTSREIHISVIGFSTVHTPNARQAFLLCAPLTEESLKYLHEKIIEYIRLLVQKYAPIAQNWLVGDSDEQIFLIPGLFESDASDEEDNGSPVENITRSKPTLELGTSDIAMLDQLRIAHKVAQLTVGKAKTAAVFVTDGVSDLPTPTVTDYLITQFRCSSVPCCFVLATSSDTTSLRKRPGLALSSYFAHMVNRAILENVAFGTNGILCYTNRQADGTLEVEGKLIDLLLYETIPCAGTHSFESPQFQIVRVPFRKLPVTVTIYPLVSARFAHGFKKCRSVRSELPSDVNMCLRWHPNITIRYYISQTDLEVWWECEAGTLQAIYPDDQDVESRNVADPAEEENVSRPAMRQTIATQIGKNLLHYLSRLATVDDLIMKIYNTENAGLPADPILRAIPLFVFNPKERQLEVHESLRRRETDGKRSSSASNEAEPIENENISDFVEYWRVVANLNAVNVKLIYTTRTMQYFLNYDRPLPKVLLTAATAGVGPTPRQTSALACRLALNNIVTYLRTSWASFELIENRAFVKFLSSDATAPSSNPSYCIVRVSDRHSPVANITVSFPRGTEKSSIDEFLDELSADFSQNVLSSAKHTAITTMFPISTPLDSFLVEPTAMLSSIEHSLPARLRRVRPMSNATLLSRIYRADRIVYELLMPGGLSPRSMFNRVLRSFIKRKLGAGYRFSSASSSYLCFSLEVPSHKKETTADEPSESVGITKELNAASFLRPLIQFNLAYSVEECYQQQTNQEGEAKGNDRIESRPHSAATTLQPPIRRMSLAVGVSSIETVVFRIVTELWILPVGVNDNGACLDKIAVDTHKQDFQLISKLYSYFVFRLVSIIAKSQKSSLEKTVFSGFTLPPSNKWYWNPPEFAEAAQGKFAVLDSLSHPVVTLTARPDLYLLLSCCQEIKIRMPLLRCSFSPDKMDVKSPENTETAKVLRDLILRSLAERFPYRNTVMGHRSRPREEGFISGVEGDKTPPVEWTMFAMTADRPEHVALVFAPSNVESWLKSPDASTPDSYISLFLYLTTFDWLFSSESKPRPSDLTVDVAEDIFVSESSEKAKAPSKSRVNSTNNNEPVDNSTFMGDTVDAGPSADTNSLGLVLGHRLADTFASVYVSAVYRCLGLKLPICSTDFELAVNSLCTESVCSEIDLKQLLLLHGTTCPEGKACVATGEERLKEVIAQWFQPAPCAPHYYFFRVPESVFSCSDGESDHSSFRHVASMSGSFDAVNWQQQFSSSPEHIFDVDNQSQTGSDSSSMSGSDGISQMEEAIEGEDRSREDEHDVTVSDDSSQPPPPLFLHCTCSVTVKPPGGENVDSTLIHIPLSSLPHCLRSLLAVSDEFDHSLSLAEQISSVVSVTLDVICIAPNPLRLPTSVSSTPVHRNAPMVNLANVMPASEGASIVAGEHEKSLATSLRRQYRRRMSSIMVRDSDGVGYFQTLSLHSSQYAAVSALVKQFHWLVFDDMIMSVPSSDLDLQQLAIHIVDTLRIKELCPPETLAESSSLPSFCPIVKRKHRPLQFVFGTENASCQSVLAETLTGWSLRTACAVVRRLGSSLYFYCAIPVRSAVDSSSLVASTPCDEDAANRQSMNMIAEDDLSLSARKLPPALAQQLVPQPIPQQQVLLPHLRRRHQSAAPLIPLRPPQMTQMFARPRRLSSSRRQVETASPPLGINAPSFLSPQKSTGDSLSTATSSPRSIFTGRGYESDNEFNEKELEEFHFTPASPVGVHTSQTCWIFCKIGKQCKFYLYVPWLSRTGEKGQVAFSLLNELVEAVEKSVRRTNQQLLLRDMHTSLLANKLMLQPSTSETQQSDAKLADELSFPSEHFACPRQYTHRFNLHPSLRLGATSHLLMASGRSNLQNASLSESMNATTPAGRALTVISGLLQNVALSNRPDVFTYQQTRERPLNDLLYYLVFTSGQTNIDERSDSEALSTTSASSSGIDIPSSVIHRDISTPLAASLSRPIPARQSSTDSSSVHSLLIAQSLSSQTQWWLDMHVQGLDPPIMAELDKLITGLQHALDKAVLQNLLSSLLKNPMHRLAKADVDFIQHSQQPTLIYFILPPLVAQSNPHTWFAYFRQSVLSGAYNFSLPHFSFTGSHASAGETTSAQNLCRFRDTTTNPPSVLDPNNTFLFFTRLESALSGIACIEAKILAPTSEVATTPVDWLKILSSSSPSQIVTDHLRSCKKSDSRSPSEWCLMVRVWERGTVISDLEMALERCISSAVCDSMTEGIVTSLIVAAASQRHSVGSISTTSSSSSSTLSALEMTAEDTITSWLQLNAFLEYVSTQLTPPAPLTVKKFHFPLMRAGFWLDAACRSLSPQNSSAGLSASGNSTDLANLVGARLYLSSTNQKFNSVLLRDTRNRTNSYRKLSKSHWVVLSSSLPHDWKKHSPTTLQPSLQVSRQCFAVIDIAPCDPSSCSATLLLYNVIPPRIENVLSELEATAKVSELQVKGGTDISCQKAGLFATQHLTTDRPFATVFETLNVLSGKIEIVKHVSTKTAPRNMPQQNQNQATKQDSWMQLPYSRVVLRDQLALPHRPRLKEMANSGYLSDVLLEFCRQISAAAESIHRRREAVIFAGKIVTSLENPGPSEDSSSTIGQLQQQQQGPQQGSMNFRTASAVVSAAKVARNRVRRRFSGRLQAIRSASASVATLDSTAMNILRHSCRLQHFVSAPLVLSPKWCQFAMQRAAPVLSVQQQPLPSLPVEELGLYIWFRDEYFLYIQRSLFLFELAVTAASGPPVQFANQNFQSSQVGQQQQQQQQHGTQFQLQHTQPLFAFCSTPGGLILVQCDLRGIDLHLRLYTYERYRASTSAMARFSELVDRCRTMTHLHSFCYDQHVRIVQSWILDGESQVTLPSNYDHAQIIRDLCRSYRRTPLYASSLICSGRTEINGLRFTTVRELIARFGSSTYDLFDETFDLKVRDVRETKIHGPFENAVSIPELIICGRERSSETIISTTLIATIRPVVTYAEDGTTPIAVSECDVEILYAVATTTKRWKELFPVETRALRVEDLLTTKAPKKRKITPDLVALALAVPRYRPQMLGGDYVISLIASASLRALVLTCYRQGLAESQWRRITSAADVLQPGGANRQAILTCADLRALTMDVSSIGTSRFGEADALGVALGCQALPLSIVDSRLARLRLASPSPSLARALRQRFPLTVWLPGPPSNEARPEFTLIIAQDRMCAVVIAWPTTQNVMTSSSVAVATSTPQSSAKVGPTTPVPGVKMSVVANTPEFSGVSPVVQSASSPTLSARKQPMALEAAELFFLARNPNAAVMARDSSNPGSPIETGLPMHQTFSLYSNPSHRLFTESVIACLAADYIRHLLTSGTPGKS